MMQVDYAGGTMLTGDAIADALLRYASALAAVGRSATIDVPGVTADGHPGTFKVLIGPASQILAEPTDRGDEVVDAELVERIEHEIAILERPAHALPFEGTSTVPDGLVD